MPTQNKPETTATKLASGPLLRGMTAQIEAQPPARTHQPHRRMKLSSRHGLSNSARHDATQKMPTQNKTETTTVKLASAPQILGMTAQVEAQPRARTHRPHTRMKPSPRHGLSNSARQHAAQKIPTQNKTETTSAKLTSGPQILGMTARFEAQPRARAHTENHTKLWFIQ